MAHLFYQCTRLQCGVGFVGYYVAEPNARANDYHRLKRIWPRTAKQHTFSDVINTVSPNFCHVYQQSMAAEAYELDQIAGIGIRKALEFLVKDYAVYENPGDAEAIHKTFLAAVIKEYIKDPSVQACATRAAWLGNDEVHYIRRWDDKDIHDLKLLVRLTVNWIENVLLTKKYVSEMPDT